MDAYSLKGKDKRMAKIYTFKGKVVDITLRFYEHSVGGVHIGLFTKAGDRINSNTLLIDSTLERPNMAVNEFARILKTLEC